MADTQVEPVPVPVPVPESVPVPVPVQAQKAKKRKKQRKTQEEEEEKKRRNQQRVWALGEEDDSVRLLEEQLFGAEEELLGRLEQVQEQPASLLVEEAEGAESGASDEDEAGRRPARRGPVWVDHDDQQDEEVDMKHRYRGHLVRGDAEVTMSKEKLQQRMREQFQKAMGGAPAWAQSDAQKKKKQKKKKKATDEDEDDDDDDDDDEDEDEEDDLMRRTGNLVASSDGLPSGVLRMKKCPHANSARPSEDRLTTVQFHPTAQVVMTAGLDQSVSLFQVDGRTNPKIQSLHLERFPVHKARFSVGGDSLIATSNNNKMFYLYDMMEGRVTPVHSVRGLNEARVKEFSVCPEGGALLLTGTRGYLHLLTLKTKEVVRSMKINGDVSGVAFTRDGSKVFVSSEEGEVYVWDMRSSRCVSRFSDDGCVRSTCIAASPSGQYLACGSQSGVVNIYSQEACLTSANPKPLRAVMNLLTAATSLTFNPSSEILAVASGAEDEAARLVHLPSLSVFSNFPVSNRKFVYRASCLDFSPHSGFFSLANNKGHAPLFRLLHYKDF